MQRAHKIRLYPTKEQEVQLLKTAGTSRYAYNWALAEWKQMWQDVEDGKSSERPSAFKLSARWTKERPDWASEVAYCAPQKAVLNVGVAFQNLWRGKAGYPQFHKKNRKDSFYIQNSKAYISGDRINLPKIGKVKLAESLRYSGKIQSYIVSHYAGQWHVSVQVEVPDAEHPCQNPKSVVGIDVGLKHVAVASDGSVLDAPESLKRLEKKLRDRQRALSRSQRNSANHRKLLLRKQKVQNKINNIRLDAAHKFTSTIAKNHGVVVIEDLDLQGMMKKAKYRSMRCALNHSMMGLVLQQLAYKAKEFKKVDRFFPSTKQCSKCGAKKDSMDLSERTYVCSECGAVVDRDMNAAINLMKAGAVSAGEPVDLVASR